MAEKTPTNLTEMLALVKELADDGTDVAFEDVLSAMGRRSFGPLLLLCGLIILAPVVGDIPGVPTTTGFLVLLVSVQLLVGRTHFWFPGWIRRRSVSAKTVNKITTKARGIARVVDRLLRQRLVWLVSGRAIGVVAAFSMVIALATPLMELVPFSANGAGAILAAFGLALVARDGVLAIAGFILTAITTAIMVMAAL